MPSDSALRVEGLSAGYGRVQVVSSVSFSVEPGEAVAMVGRNGAGKTTSLSAIGGLRYGPGTGTVRVGLADVSHRAAHEIVVAGLKLVPEGRRIFKEMTVLENLRLGAFIRRKESAVDAELERVWRLFPVLFGAQHGVVSSLSGGQQQMVAIGQAIMSRPSFMLLDEPTAGLAPALIDHLYDAFAELCREGIGLLIVDQNIERVLESTNRFVVVDNGRVVLDGLSEQGALEEVTKIVLGNPGPQDDPSSPGR